MRVLDLFSGIGGFALGLQRAGVTPVPLAFCEVDPFCRAVLSKHWPGVPIWGDIREVPDAAVVALGRIDLVCGGFPCQPWSVAGKRRGVEDERHLWPEMLRIIHTARPRWVLGENVPGLRVGGADLVLGGLEAEGYTCWAAVVGAHHVGAPHRRDRCFIVAHSGDDRLGGGRKPAGKQGACGDLVDGRGERGAGAAGVADADKGRCRRGDGLHERGPAGPLASIAASGSSVADPNRGVLREQQQRVSGRREGGVRNQGPSEPGAAGDRVADANECRRNIGSGPPCEFRGVGESQDRTWPAGRGEPQHPWEPPRTIAPPQSGVGSDPDGVSPRLVRTARRLALRAYGNAVVPQVVEMIGRAILAAESRGPQ